MEEHFTIYGVQVMLGNRRFGGLAEDSIQQTHNREKGGCVGLLTADESGVSFFS